VAVEYRQPCGCSWSTLCSHSIAWSPNSFATDNTAGIGFFDSVPVLRPQCNCPGPCNAPVHVPTPPPYEYLGKGNPTVSNHYERGLYEGFIVNPETSEISSGPVHIIASDEEGAKMELARSLPEDVAVEDYDFIVNHLGTVRAKTS
jgi:hypothetical protein